MGLSATAPRSPDFALVASAREWGVVPAPGLVETQGMKRGFFRAG
ncbi:MAG: hypothetical protein RL077_3762 [Verrucomicrobiota bacterium]